MSPGWTTSRPKPAATINNLPNEVLLEIFSYLPLEDMVRSAAVCESWRGLLKGQKELWRGKEWTSSSVDATQKLLAYCAGIPQLRSLRMLFEGEFRIHIAWPDVTVHLYLGLPFRWEPYFRSLDTESLVVSTLVTDHNYSCIECVDKRTLKRICVAEQDLVFHQSRSRPYFNFLPTSPHYSCPVPSRQWCALAHSAEQCHRPDDFVTGDESASRRAAVSDSSEPEGAGATEVSIFTCPALEVVNVHSSRLSDVRLSDLCAMGPVRVLRVFGGALKDFWVLRRLSGDLEELIVTDCSGMAAWDYYELRKLAGLRVLRLGKCRLEEAVLRDITADMEQLRTLSLNGRELLTCDC